MSLRFEGTDFNIVLWGLKSKRDSFRFIFLGYYETLKRKGISVFWVDDLPKSLDVITKNSLVLGVDIASKHLLPVNGATYVTLNVQANSNLGLALQETGKWFKIQEFTNQSPGLADSEGSIAKFKVENKTLYMPWGTPILEKDFLPPFVPIKNSTKEYWVGAIWNDSLNQGNIDAISEFRRSLKKLGVQFHRVGGSRLRIGGLDESQNAQKIRASRLGAAIVGNWQKTNQYYPCRIFKAVSAGVPPISNLDARPIFGGDLLWNTNISELVDSAMAESKEDRRDRTLSAQEKIKNYTYLASLRRILRVVNDEW